MQAMLEYMIKINQSQYVFQYNTGTYYNIDQH